MGVKFTSKFNAAKIADNINQSGRVTLLKAVQDEKAQMDIRTGSGRDVNDSEFVQYSDGYGNQVEEKTGNRNVDLLDTGAMLQAIVVNEYQSENKVEARVEFSMIDMAQRAIHNMKLRKFFGFSKDQFDRIKLKVQQSIRG